MGDRHLFALVGTSNKIVVVLIVEFIDVVEDDLYEFVESMVSSTVILGIEYGTEVSDAHWLRGVFIEDERDTSENCSLIHFDYYYYYFYVSFIFV